MWLKECFNLFPEITHELTGRRQELDKLETALSNACSDGTLGRRELEIIETSPWWDYPLWWPRLSKEIGQPIELPKKNKQVDSRRKIIDILFERVKHIEVVSVVLRFIYPQDYGILSPPVSSLLNLNPTDNHVDDYYHYLLVLDDLRWFYEVFERVADIDMALWSAAHLSYTRRIGLGEEMRRDPHFQEVRLRNLLAGFGDRWGRSDHERLILSRVLMEHDSVLAALIAARCFEAVIREIANKFGISPGVRKFGQTEFSALVDALRRRRELIECGISSEELGDWRDSRNEAVHAERGISKQKARDLVEGTYRLFRSLDAISSNS